MPLTPFDQVIAEQTTSCPLVTLGGVPLIEQEISWSLIAGTLPFQTQFIVPKGPLNNQIRGLTNPVSLRIVVDGGINRERSEKAVEFKNLHLLEEKQIDEFTSAWVVADNRYLLRGKKMFFKYNITRIRNEIASSVQGVASTDPAIIRQPYDVFKTGRYLQGSVKLNGSPFTISEILQIELAKLGIPTSVDPALLSAGDYIIENLRSDGIDAYTMLAELLRKSRLDGALDKDGIFHIFSVDFLDEESLAKIALLENLGKNKISPAITYPQERSRLRPQKITIRFEKLHEVLVKAVPPQEFVSPPANSFGGSIIDFVIQALTNVASRASIPAIVPAEGHITQADVDERKVIGCVNVIRVPFVPTTASFGYHVGEYIPFLRYISEFGLTEKDVRELWWSIALEFEISKRVKGANSLTIEIEALAQKIAASIRASYRQLFMIDPFFIDKIDVWETKKLSVVDNYSANRPPSSLWSDFAMVPRNRHPDIAKNRGLFQDGIINWIVDERDPNRLNPTAGTISPENHDLGVFRVSYSSDVDTVIEQIIPSAIDNPPSAKPSGVTNLARFLLTRKSPLAEKFTLEADLTVKWMFDPKTQEMDSPKIYHDLTFDYTNNSQGPALGPPIVFLCRDEYARETRFNQIANLGILEAIGQAQAAFLFNQFIDRTVGVVDVAGLQDDFRIVGNIREISTRLSPSKGLYQRFDMQNIPFAPELIQQLPNDVRAYLYKQLGRNNTA